MGGLSEEFLVEVRGGIDEPGIGARGVVIESDGGAVGRAQAIVPEVGNHIIHRIERIQLRLRNPRLDPALLGLRGDDFDLLLSQPCRVPGLTLLSPARFHQGRRLRRFFDIAFGSLHRSGGKQHARFQRVELERLIRRGGFGGRAEPAGEELFHDDYQWVGEGSMWKLRLQRARM